MTATDIAITGLSASNNGPTAMGDSTTLNATIMQGSGVTYSWNFGDSTSGSGVSPTHTYTAPGSYTATVTATNMLGSTTASTIVVVAAAPIRIFLPLLLRP